MITEVGVINGAFDPPTNGHLELIKNGSQLCQKLIIVVSTPTVKRVLFTAEERANFLRSEIKKIDLKNVDVITTTLDSVSFILNMEKKPNILIRGLRDVEDYVYEKRVIVDKNIEKFNEFGIQVIFIPEQKLKYVSSTNLRRRVRDGEDISDLTSQEIGFAFIERYQLLRQFINNDKNIPEDIDPNVVNTISKKVVHLSERILSGEDVSDLLTFEDANSLKKLMESAVMNF